MYNVHNMYTYIICTYAIFVYVLIDRYRYRYFQLFLSLNFQRKSNNFFRQKLLFGFFVERINLTYSATWLLALSKSIFYEVVLEIVLKWLCPHDIRNALL